MNEIDELLEESKMDYDCVAMCRALNGLNGITTVESCSGHGEQPYRIFFEGTAVAACQVFGAIDRLGGEGMLQRRWFVCLDTNGLGEPSWILRCHDNEYDPKDLVCLVGEIERCSAAGEMPRA